MTEPLSRTHKVYIFNGHPIYDVTENRELLPSDAEQREVTVNFSRLADGKQAVFRERVTECAICGQLIDLKTGAFRCSGCFRIMCKTHAARRETIGGRIIPRQDLRGAETGESERSEIRWWCRRCWRKELAWRVLKTIGRLIVFLLSAVMAPFRAIRDDRDYHEPEFRAKKRFDEDYSNDLSEA